MAAEHDRLAGIEQGVREIKSDVSETKEAVAGLKVTVDLLVAGKIKQQSGDGGSKITMAALEIARMALAALFGFFAGKGG